MSWDATLYIPGPDAGDVLTRLHAWCGRQAHFVQNPSGSGDDANGQWWYENEDTGVYFSVEYGPAEDAAEAPQGFAPAQIAVNVNFARPHYFGLEVMPLLAAMADDLGCALRDHQGDDQPRAPVASDLIETWNDGNAMGTQMVIEHAPDHPRWNKQAARQWWEYQRVRKELVAALGGEDVFVPAMLLVTLPENPRVVSVAVWPDGIPLVVPPSELIAGSYDQKRLFRTKRIEMLYRTEDVVQALADRLSRRNVDGVSYDVLLPDEASGSADLLATIEPVGPQSLANGRGLSQLGFVEL